MTSQMLLDFADWFSPAEGPFLQEICNQLQFSLPSSDIYRALREPQNKSQSRSQIVDQGQPLILLGPHQPLSTTTRIIWGCIQGCCL